MQPSNTLHDNKLNQLRFGLSKTAIAFDKNALAELGDYLDSAKLPSTKDEPWKYTRLTKLSNTTFIGSSQQSSPVRIHSKASQIIFDNGKLVSKDAIAGCAVLTELTETELSKINIQKEVFDALNMVYAENGVFMEISGVLKNPIEIVHLSNGNKINNLRHIIRIKENAQAEISMIFAAEQTSKSFSNIISEIHLENGAHLTLNKLQIEEGQDFHISRDKIIQNRNSHLTLNTLTLNGQFVRNEVTVDVIGSNAETNLNGVYIPNKQQFVDNHTTIDHKVAHCQSNELYKGVLFDRASGVFNGKVFVRKDAQKISAFQSNANILMSQDATINSKPELEIYADDVRCSHGSTTGQLDEEAIFYLRSRGLSEIAARKLLVTAFVSHVLDKIKCSEVCGFVLRKLNERLGL